MALIHSVVRKPFDFAEQALGKVFPAQWNPLLNLGALGFFFYWIITASGIYVYIFFDTGIHNAYASIEYMTHEQWYMAGVMRSLHRYASDALIVVMLLHLVREFGLERYRGARWFSWVTGIAVLMLIYVSGISGYWLVWDKLAQYVAIVSTEWLDWLPIFGEPVARNFLSPQTLDNRFFTLMIFMHIAVPLIALAVLWIHLQRVSKPRINPPRGLAIGTFVSMLALSLVFPAVSQAPADLAQVPGTVGLDWFYLPLYPLLENWPGTVTWTAAFCMTVIAFAVPFLPPMRKLPVAVVDLENCNGCSRCHYDCPYEAIDMIARTDGRPFEAEPAVDASKCVACGICAGSCPTSMPFRRVTGLSPGIDLPDLTMETLRDQVHDVCDRLTGDNRVLIFSCMHAVPAKSINVPGVASVELRCIGHLPPAFIDYVLSRKLADGVLLAGCSENACHARLGVEWTQARIAGERDPHLRARVPRERVRTVWVGRSGSRLLESELSEFSSGLSAVPGIKVPPAGPATRERDKVDA